MLDSIADAARTRSTQRRTIPEILSRVSQYEMAYRMQTSVPEVADISNEPDHVLDLYGPDVRKPGTFARNCLLARRLAERDVRYHDGRVTWAGITTTAIARSHPGVVPASRSTGGRAGDGLEAARPAR